MYSLTNKIDSHLITYIQRLLTFADKLNNIFTT